MTTTCRLVLSVFISQPPLPRGTRAVPKSRSYWLMSSGLPPRRTSGASWPVRRSWMKERDERMSDDARVSWTWLGGTSVAVDGPVVDDDGGGGGGVGVGDCERMKKGLSDKTTWWGSAMRSSRAGACQPSLGIVLPSIPTSGLRRLARHVCAPIRSGRGSSRTRILRCNCRARGHRR